MANRLLQKASVLATIALVAGVTSTSRAGIVTNDPALPPTGGKYVDSASEYFGPGVGVVLGQLVLRDFTNIVEIKIGPDEIQSFDAVLSGEGDVNGGGASTFAVSGPVQMLAENKADTTTGTFDIEVVDLGLSGSVEGISLLIRESPTVASTGQTTIIDIGGGQYAVESFFDLFTEISVDGGQTWMPASESSRFTLQAIPLPAALPLLATALLSLVSINFTPRGRAAV